VTRRATARVGVLSDTHGLLRPEALRALRGVDAIIHAGDVGDPAVLDALAAIAPVTAVRGNNDRGSWARTLPATALLEVAARRIYVVHELAHLDIDPVAARVDVVIAGHSHRPSIETRGGVLYLNPGSTGPRRFSLPIALAVLTASPERVDAQIVTLAVPLKRAAPRGGARRKPR
jgi:putative phosphoesterase